MILYTFYMFYTVKKYSASVSEAPSAEVCSENTTDHNAAGSRVSNGWLPDTTLCVLSASALENLNFGRKAVCEDAIIVLFQ